MLRPFFTLLSSARDAGGEWYEFLVRKPLVRVGGHGIKVATSFRDLPKRQFVAVYGGLLWVVPITMVSQFESLYMVRLGLSETELGVYRGLMNLVALVGFFIGGYVSDFWGRRRALILFDIISWGGFCLSMSLASGKWWCVSGLFFMALVSAAVPAYLCLLSEGISDRKRVTVFSVLQVVNQAPSALFFLLLGGLWVDQRGFLQANHEMYWLFTGLVAIGIYYRWRELPDSKAYEKPPASWFHALGDGIRQYRRSMGSFLRKPGAKGLLISKFLDEWILQVWLVTYASLFYVDRLGLEVSSLSVVNQGAVYAGILVLFLLIPNISKGLMIRLLGAGQVLGLASIGVLFLAKPGSESVLLICLLSGSLGSMGNALYNSINAAALMNIMGEKERAKAVAATFALVRIGLVTTSFGAVLYGQVSPESLLMLIGVLRIVGFFLLRRVSRILTTAR